MKKIFITLLITLVCLTGCKVKTTNTVSDEKLSKYATLYQSVLANETFVGGSRYYNIEVEYLNTDAGYNYYIVLDEAQVAMYDVEIIVVEGLLPYNEVEMMPTIGIFDNAEYNMIPFQVNVDLSYVKGIVVSGDMDEMRNLYALVTWKDVTRVNTYREFIEFVAPTDGSAGDHDQTDDINTGEIIDPNADEGDDN